jgi:hypothetical protein
VGGVGGMGMGGSFLGTAASTAAGVIGGALLLDGIRSMMGHSAAHAAIDPSGHAVFDPGATPWGSDASGGHLSQEAGLDDIGAPQGAAESSSSRLLDDSGSDYQDVGDYDDTDDGGFDMDDGGGTEDV